MSLAVPFSVEIWRRCVRRTVTWIALTLPCLLTACGPNSVAPGHAFEIVEEDGVTVARNSATPRFSGELFRYETVVTLRPDPDVPESFLYDPFFVAMDDRERVYVAEQGNFRVSVWALDGSYLHSIGQRGEGPGEFPFGPVLGLEIGNEILSVPMLQNGRTIRFRTDGSYLDTLSAPTVPRAMSIQQAASGALIAIDQPGDDGLRARATVLDENGETTAVLETPTVQMTNYSGGPRAVFVPPDMILMTTGEEPIVRFHGLDGAVRREVRIDLPTLPVTDADRAALVDYIDERTARAPESRDEPGGESGTKEQWRRRREGVTFPEFKAHWGFVLVSDSGWLWLLASRPETLDYTANDAMQAHIVSPAGRYVGDTTFPEIFAPTAVRGVYLLALVNDADTGERLPTVFRVVPAVAGFEYPGS